MEAYEIAFSFSTGVQITQGRCGDGIEKRRFMLFNSIDLLCHGDTSYQVKGNG